MKKNYTNPVVEISTFDIEDVVMVSTVDMSAGKLNDTIVSDFKEAVGAQDSGAVFVQW